MELLSASLQGSPHFVRCLKPNRCGSPSEVDAAYLVHQLRCGGVLEAVRARKEGFSHRLSFAEFLRRYCFLGFDFDERVLATRETCQLLLARLRMDGFRLGRTKVFLRHYHVEYLSQLCEAQGRRVVRVQAAVRRWLAAIRCRREKWAVARKVFLMRVFATRWRNRALSRARKKKEEEKEKSDHNKNKMENLVGSPSRSRSLAAVEIQRHIRGYFARKRIGPLLAKRLERAVKDGDKDRIAQVGRDLQEEGLTPDEAATLIQSVYRWVGWVARVILIAAGMYLHFRRRLRAQRSFDSQKESQDDKEEEEREKVRGKEDKGGVEGDKSFVFPINPKIVLLGIFIVPPFRRLLLSGEGEHLLRGGGGGVRPAGADGAPRQRRVQPGGKVLKQRNFVDSKKHASIVEKLCVVRRWRGPLCLDLVKEEAVPAKRRKTKEKEVERDGGDGDGDGDGGGENKLAEKLNNERRTRGKMATKCGQSRPTGRPFRFRRRGVFNELLLQRRRPSRELGLAAGRTGQVYIHSTIDTHIVLVQILVGLYVNITYFFRTCLNSTHSLVSGSSAAQPVEEVAMSSLRPAQSVLAQAHTRALIGQLRVGGGGEGQGGGGSVGGENNDNSVCFCTNLIVQSLNIAGYVTLHLKTL